MNILLYVTTVLMLLSVLTYARLENFKSLMGMQTGFVHYMSSIEHQSINRSAEIWYERLHPNSKNGSSNSEKNTKACSRLSFHLFLNVDDRNKHPAEYQKTRELIKQLMADLFKSAKFYKETIVKHPNFRDEILDEIQRAAESLPKGKSIKSAGELLNLEFQNQDLHLAFYEMMNGMPKESLKEAANSPMPADKSFIITTESDEDTDEPSSEVEETHAPPGNVSLLDFITLQSTLKVRVFLASRLLLMAIYGDSFIVDQVIEKRQDLYRRLKANPKGIPLKQLEEEFRASYGQMGHAPEYAEILDFIVSKTDPNKYK